MTKTHLENTKNDDKWQGNNKTTRMPTKKFKLQQTIVGMLKRHIRNTLRNIWLCKNFFLWAKGNTKGH
jgi:hypothetical protein